MVERRLAYLASIVLIWGGTVFYKILSIQVVHHRQFVAKARARQELKVEIPAPRGTLFDRAGRVLAMSIPTETVYINPLKVDIAVSARILAGVLNLDPAELHQTIDQAFQKGRGYLIIKRGISREEAHRLRSLGLEWIGFQRDSRRHYPKLQLAAHVLGSVDFEERGNAGIEKALDSQLRGIPGQMRLLTDVKRRGIDSNLTTDAHAGTAITLTIDERLQFAAERDLAAAVISHHAVSGSAVLMDPRNGDILAMASYPSYDPNLPPQTGEPANARNNHAVSVPFEPGSVFKVITLSAALETTSLTPESMINCHGGVLKLPGRIVHDSHLGYGIMPMAMVLAKSSNIGAIEVGTRVGQQNMYEYMRRFGFGQKTGIELPAESSGKLRRLSRWGRTSLASVSMGQEVSVTTVQLAQAASVIANGGLLVRPRLVKKRGDRTVAPAQPVRVVKPETAITMRQMMEGVVLHGTGTAARLAGYTVGGKTGSAQIYDVAARHYTHTYNGSFVGFSPLTNPSIVLVVTLNGTHGSGGFGGAAAAPVFRTVGTEAMRVLDIPKDIVDEPPAKMTTVIDDLAAVDDRPGEPNILEETSDDSPARPADGGPVRATGDRPAQPTESGPTVPNFRGKTMRAVFAEATAMGLTVLPTGSGVARAQSPPAGTVLQQGERIRVQFAR
jgi:cell division protein FtsI (penicillin-binding protein 3)